MAATSAWLTLWTAILVVTLSVFAVLTVVVAVGGYFDVKELFRSIDQRHAESRDETSSEQQSGS